MNVTANAKNQTNNWCYDLAGNIIDPTQPCPTPAPSSYPNVYDAENRMTSATVAGVATGYDYDADGHRVKKSNANTNTLYWYGPGGEVLEETDLSGGLINDYVFFEGTRTARIDGLGAVHYYFSDHLGSASVITNASGSMIEEESDYFPFGGEIVIAAGPNHYKFTGKERDPETGCDYFGARYYCNTVGRFIAPDWAAAPTAVPYANFGNPQSLNLYSYVQNNPTTMGDPDGHGCDRGGWCGYIRAAVNAYLSDNAFGAFRGDVLTQYTAAEQRGAALGDGLAFVEGGAEATVGTLGNGAGAVLDLSGVGALVGIPVNVVSTGLMLHGGGTAIVGGAHLLNDLNQNSSTSTSTESKPYENTPENQERKQQGKAPIGKDGKPVELHHEGQKADSSLKEMTRTDHRGGENFKKNHQNTGQQRSEINRSEFNKTRRQHWKTKGATQVKQREKI